MSNIRHDLRLRSVNWEHGMLLTPDHFLRQEEYLESLFAWTLSYATPGAGLLGGGVRLPESDLGAVRNDPEVALDENAEALSISVTKCRGVTPSGLIVDVEESGALSERFPKERLAGVAEAILYVVCEPGERHKVEGAADPFNPQMKTERAYSYRVALDVTAAERQHALAVARVRRPVVGMHYEKDPNYIPPCMALSAHSELTAGCRRIVDAVNRMASGYAELHRAMREFLVLFTERGIETVVDRDSIAFAERMVMALQETAYGLLDRNQSPTAFFGKIRKFLHTAAIFFDLAPGMQQYYEMLRETGETELVALMELQKHALQMGRTLRLQDDLSVEVRNGVQSLAVLEKLEWALEGKYIDFRKSPSLESTNFIFDRGGKTLYKLAAKPSRVQGVVDELTIFFSNLRLEGRDRYRMILVGDRNAPYTRGTSIGAEIRLNEGSGYRREAIILTAEAKLDEQYNLELDFEAPDVPTITDLRVTVPAYHAVHTALLFMRHRFYAGRVAGGPEIRYENSPSGFSPSVRTEGEAPTPVQQPSSSRPGESFGNGHRESYPSDPQAAPPWTPRERGTEPSAPDDTLSRPRRRRLE